MIYAIADNITSPLADTTEGHYRAVREGRSALGVHTDPRGLLEPYTAALFTGAQWEAMETAAAAFAPEGTEGLSRFEALAAISVRRALDGAEIDAASPRTVFILSSTKGNVARLTADAADPSPTLATAARRIARSADITTEPVCVCNACISGLAAIILGQRLIESGAADTAVVCGAEEQSAFIISGFQSLMAMSAAACRPFDMERNGLNLGEAAATIVLSRRPLKEDDPVILRGAVRNDAHHVSTPSPRGEGLVRCLDALGVSDKAQVAFISAHGTATLFNDQMESVAVERAGYSATPLNTLKGTFGHTMGAAGVLETILSLRALRDGIVLPSRGYEERGVSGHVSLSSEERTAAGTLTVKMLAGFGGCNAALLAARDASVLTKEETERAEGGVEITTRHTVSIRPEGVSVDGAEIETEGTGAEMLTAVYRSRVGDYPKFFKMDRLSRLGFLAAELLTQADDAEDVNEADVTERRAVVLFNTTSSVWADRKYLETIRPDHYFPGPSIFVYTLPNIVTGEIAIRRGLHAETSFFILPRHDAAREETLLRAVLADGSATTAITGYIDYERDDAFTADLRLVSIERI